MDFPEVAMGWINKTIEAPLTINKILAMIYKSNNNEEEMEPKDITYKIMVDEETGDKQYFLDDEPWTFIDPSLVKVGSLVWFDPNGLDRYGIVTNIREADFIYYDVGFADNLNIEEIAMFQVYKVGERNDQSN